MSTKSTKTKAPAVDTSAEHEAATIAAATAAGCDDASIAKLRAYFARERAAARTE